MWVIDSPGVYDVRGLHVPLEIFCFEFSELVPLGHDDAAVGSLESSMGILRIIDLFREYFLCVGNGHGVVCDDMCAFFLETLDDSQRGGLSGIVRVLLERET